MDSNPVISLQIIESFLKAPFVWIIAIFFVLFTPSNLSIKLLVRYTIYRLIYSEKRRDIVTPYLFGLRFIIYRICDRHCGLENDDVSKKADELFDNITIPGAWEGILERSILFFLVLIGEYGAAAWVMLAKGFIIQGIAQRASKLQPEHPRGSEEKNRIEAVVYLIGTIASFTIAILGGLLFRNYLERIGCPPIIKT